MKPMFNAIWLAAARVAAPFLVGVLVSAPLQRKGAPDDLAIPRNYLRLPSGHRGHDDVSCRRRQQYQRRRGHDHQQLEVHLHGLDRSAKGPLGRVHRHPLPRCRRVEVRYEGSHDRRRSASRRRYCERVPGHQRHCVDACRQLPSAGDAGGNLRRLRWGAFAQHQAKRWAGSSAPTSVRSWALVAKGTARSSSTIGMASLAPRGDLASARDTSGSCRITSTSGPAILI